MQRAELLPWVGISSEYWDTIERAKERGMDTWSLIQNARDEGRQLGWRGLVAFYDRAIALGTVPYDVWTKAAIAHLEMDDEDGYRRVCQILRDRHPAVFDERHACENLTVVLSLGPGGVGDDGKALGWIEPLAATIDPADRGFKRQCLRTLGAVLYRLGRYREAIDRIQEGIALGRGEATPEEAVLEAVFLAMAHFRMGDTEKARALLAGPWSDEPDPRLVGEWWNDRPLRLLRREAARLILDRDFPSDPFVP